mmetsp:Transcript_4362/g.8779  ORF Transcript_4362/g.8779 Transcript_4362/m.8779 type:complete len:242 (-) Transcript_4362:1710-2435(-)
MAEQPQYTLEVPTAEVADPNEFLVVNSQQEYIRARDNSIAQTLGESRLKVGERCIFYRDDTIYFGTVRYLGPLTDVHIDGSDSMRQEHVVGIETDHVGDGLCNGMIGERQYFEVPEKKGIFVSAVKVYPMEFKASGIFQGIMQKKGQKRRNWKTRYFLVQRLFMYYFMVGVNQEPYGEPLGVVPLFGMDILPFGGKPNGFMLKNKLSAGARTWYFSCETPSELELWINALREAKKVALIGQ